MKEMHSLMQSLYFDENDALNCTIKKLKTRSETHLERKIQDQSPTKRSVAAVKIVQAMGPVLQWWWLGRCSTISFKR